MASRISQLGTFDVRRVLANIWIFHDSALYFLNIWTRYIYIYICYIYMLYIYMLYIYVIYICYIYIYMLYIYICYIVDCNNPLTWENCSNPFTIIPVDFALSVVLLNWPQWVLGNWPPEARSRQSVGSRFFESWRRRPHQCTWDSPTVLK